MASLTISPQASAASSSMASSSSASTSYSPPPWDVFINHRGPDVKRTFASYLYRSLVSRGLRVFLDKEELEAGQNIPSQIQQAIRGAAVHVAIFSETYAESTWCLDELVLMVESVQSGKIILPVFYKVEPSVLRHTVKDGAYADALRKLEGKTAHDSETGEKKPRYNSDSFRKWRDALSFVADISGFVIRDEDDEGELLDEVVESVLKSVQESLKRSYDSLSLDDQQIFLDIASFFTGEKRDVAIRIWGLPGLQNLEDKCLLYVDAESSIRMHDYIRDLARNIAQEGLGTRRLWEQSTEDIDDLLQQSSHTMTEVHGITMLGCHSYKGAPPGRSEMAMPWRTRWRDKVFGIKHLFNDSRSCGISDLEFVATEDRYLERILKKARSPNLRWLRWYKCPYSCLPSWIPMENLRVLEVAGDKLETLWQAESEAPLQLRELRIWRGSSFSKFPKSIGQLKYLEKITLSANPDRLKSLPEEFCELPCLKYLDLENCWQITSLPDSFGRLTRLQHIKLHHACSLRTLPESFGNLTHLKSLDLNGCYKLAFPGTTLVKITTLEYLDINYCDNVTKLPTQLEHQLSLKELHMADVWLEELPSWIGNQCNLEALTIGGDWLEVLPLPQNLKKLVIGGASRLKYLPDHFMKMNNLLYLKVWGCPLLELPFKRIEEERESFHDDDKCLFALKEISLSHTKVSEVFFSGCVCPNLQSLSLTECKELTQIGGLSGLSKLQCLDIHGCVRLEELPNLEMLISLETLNVSTCKKLRSIPGLGQLKKLRNKLESFHDDDKCLFALKEISLFDTAISEVFFSGCVCPNLQSLSLICCEKLTQIGGLSGLSKLQCLDISGCVRLEQLPNLEMLISLETLDVSKCKMLRSIPGLGQLKKLRSLDVNQCHEIVELSGAKHLMLLKYLSVCDCPKLDWRVGELEQLRQRLKTGLRM